MKIFKIAKENKKYIAVDLDGTLAHYDEWIGPENIGEPIEKMVNRVKNWLKEGKKVKILTARVSGLFGEEDAEISRKAIEKWLEEVFGDKGAEIEITCIKDQNMEQLWDDRAVSVRKNTGETYRFE